MAGDTFVVTFKAVGAEAVAKAAKRISDRMEHIGGAIKRAGKIMSGVGAAGVASFGFALNQARQRVDEFAKTALRLETTTENIQALTSAAKLSGTTIDRLAPGIQRLSAAVAQAAQSGKGAQFDALAALGFDRGAIAQLAQQNQMTIFQAVGNAFSKLQGAQQQLAGQSLFGQRAFGQLQPFIRGGGFENMNRITERNRRLGIGISEGAGGSAEQIGDKLQDIGDVFKGLIDTMAGSPETLQALQSFESAMHDLIDNMGGGAEIARQFAASIKTIGDAIAAPGRFGSAIGSGLFDLVGGSTTDVDKRNSTRKQSEDGTYEGVSRALRDAGFKYGRAAP